MFVTSTIHFVHHIPINQSYFNVENLSAQILSNLTYQQLWLVVIGELSLVGTKMFNVSHQNYDL
jgi:membrane protease subunit (stomatin/prohibitin family)